MKASPYAVAVIGAGYTGVALTIELLSQLADGSRLLLLGTPKSVGLGLAYGTNCPDHLLNVRAANMSARAGDKEHFVRWLEETRGSSTAHAQSYVPRAAYGRYLQETLYRAIAEASSRVTCEILEGTAVDVEKLDRGFKVRVASGQTFTAATLALCLGNGPPRLPFAAEGGNPPAGDRLIVDPFSDHRMASIPRDANVLMIGTGLTMVDQVLTLERAGHRGPIVAVSRHGRLPHAHGDSATQPLATDLAAHNPALSRIYRAVVAAARQEMARGGDWRNVIDGLRPVSQALWQALTPSDRRRFRRHVESIWSIHRHRMAPAVATRIAELQHTGRLAVRAGRIVAIRSLPRSVVAAVRPRGKTTVELLSFDWLINCSGIGGELTSDPLFARLMARGLARADDSGLLDVAADCGMVARDGRTVAGLFALGPATRGRFGEITAVPDIRGQCATVGATISEAVGTTVRWWRSGEGDATASRQASSEAPWRR